MGSLKPLQKESKTSFILNHEEQAAREMIDQQFVELTGKPLSTTYKTAGYFLTVKLFVRPDELKVIDTPEGPKTIYLAPEIQKEDKFQTTVGLVCDMGPQAYKGSDKNGNERFPEGPWCKVGDFVEFARGECIPKAFRSVAMGSIADDRIIGVVEDPMDIAPINTATKV